MKVSGRKTAYPSFRLTTSTKSPLLVVALVILAGRRRLCDQYHNRPFRQDGLYPVEFGVGLDPSQV